MPLFPRSSRARRSSSGAVSSRSNSHGQLQQVLSAATAPAPNDRSVRWIGSCAFGGPHTTTEATGYPIRIKADALGDLRPVQDLIVSPRFRVLSNHPSCAALFGSSETLAPAVDLMDGDTVLEVRPPEDLMFYNLMFDSHQIIQANGLDTESYHPGNFGVSVMTLEMQHHLRQIFPHLDGDLARFGRTIRPILKGFEAEVLRVG